MKEVELSKKKNNEIEVGTPLTSTTAEVALFDKFLEFVTEPHWHRTVVRRQHVAQILQNHVP